jgi:ABC-2 type transport system permease protein
MSARTYDRNQPFDSFARAPDGGRLHKGVVGTFVGAWRARTYIRLLGNNREPSWVFFETVLPMLSVIGYLYIYRYLAGGAPGTERFVSFVVLGGAMVAFWLSVLWGIANHIFWEKQSGNLELYFVSPVSPMAMMLGMATGSLVSTSMRASATIAAGVFLFGAAFDTSGVPAAFGILVLTLAAVYCLGMMFASIFLVYGREGEHLAHSLQEPVFFAAGFYYPASTLPLVVQAAGSVVPLTFGLDAIRQVLIPGMSGLLPPSVEVAALAAMLGGFALGARFSLRRMEWKAKREGRLTLRWQ